MSPASSPPTTSLKSWNDWSPSGGAPAHVRSDNGREFVARTLQGWLATRHIKTLYIEPASPWQNGRVESFHGSLRDEFLDRELMLRVAEARVVIEDYRWYDNEGRPHGGIGYRTPAQAFNETQALDAKGISLRRPELDPPAETATRTT